MPPLNSYSLANAYAAPDPNYMYETSSERVFEEKGLFIIPYLQGRKVARITAECEVIYVPNESRSLWTNPEIGFYGYCHARSYKQSFGNPVQINQRNQVVFEWHPPSITLTLNIALQTSFLGAVQSIIDPGPSYFMDGPAVTDFSFGFQQNGRYKVTVKVWYIDPQYFGNEVLQQISQPIPYPEDVQAIDPRPTRDFGDPQTPLSPDYVPDEADFGESDGVPRPPDLPGEGQFRIVFSSNWQATTAGPAGSYTDVPCSGRTLIGPIESIDGPIFNGLGQSVVFNVVDVQGSTTLFAIQAPTFPSIYNQFVANFQYRVEAIN